MKRVVLASASAAALCLFAAPAMAQFAPQSGAYGTLGYAHMDGRGVDLGAIQGRLGYKFAPAFGVEAEGAVGVNRKDITVGPVTYDVRMQRSLAAYAVGAVPLSDNFEIFGRAGYGNTRLKADSAVGTVTGHGDSWNYGAGGQYFFDGANGLRADFTRHDFRHGRGKADVWGISYIRRF